MAEVRGVLIMQSLRFIIVLSLSSLISSRDYAPVVVWDSDSHTSLPVFSAGDHLSQNELESEVLTRVSKAGPVFVFLQDSLSSEDFVLYGNYRTKASKTAFPNLEKILNTYSYTFLPSVESPGNIVSLLARDRNVVEATNAEYALKEVKDNVVVFNLPPTSSVTDRQMALSKNDQIIGNIMKKAKALFPTYTALYTALKSKWSISDSDVRTVRHILEFVDASNETGTFWNFNDCFYMYSKKLTLRITYRSPVDPKILNDTTFDVPLKEISIDQSQSSCDANNSAIIVMKFEGTAQQELLLLQMSLNFTRQQTNDWFMSMLSVTYQTSDTKKIVDADLKTNEAWAPVGYSWNCGLPKFTDKNNSYPRTQLEFSKLQFQVFDVKNETFGDPFDCVGFFTVGIWMSIFSSLILIMILAFGITMVMSINTNDRFDDPKGKTITVTASD